VRGKNLTTDDNLYNIMPLNLKLAVTQDLGGWSNSAEFLAVAAKTRVSQVRNEVPTDSYQLFNLRSSYEWKQARVDFAIENVFDRFYSMPLGGAYVGQGNTMALNGIPWGVPMPGMGRSFNVGLNIQF
jgi:iron complex outermembrane receptor protein